jgi:hypothetical protein
MKNSGGASLMNSNGNLSNINQNDINLSKTANNQQKSQTTTN